MDGEGEGVLTERTVALPVMLVGIDESEHSYYALEWALKNLLAGSGPSFRLVVVHAKPAAASIVGLAGAGISAAGAVDVLPFVESDLRKIAARVIDHAKQLCESYSVCDVRLEAMEGDPRSVLCDAVEKHDADMLVVGSHGYGALKRTFLGSVSDYCAHHAKCTVMVVKKPKNKH